MLRKARLDPMMRARVVARTPLVYRDGADAREDRPAHVRAGSALAWHGDRLAVVQDDASFVAFVDVATGAVDVVALPRGEGGRRLFGDDLGNKRFKLDLEACVALPEGDGTPRLLAFGSGSGSDGRRDHIVVIRGAAPTDEDVRIIDARRLYDRLRALTAFAGSELNVEGAVVVGDRLVLFQRGNGAPRGPLAPVNATCEMSLADMLAFLEEPAVAEVPATTAICQFDLGAMEDCRLTFTDATASGAEIVYLAAAEASADAVTDGVVTGVALGLIAEGSDSVRYTLVEDEAGRALCEKVEGIAPSRAEPGAFYGVLDCDDSTRPSELLEIRVSAL